MISEKIGRYQIKSRIGNGGMATVYLAYDPHFARNVAIKVISDHFLNETQSHKRFQREAKTIAQLEHPAIVPVYDYGEYNNHPYLVMRYMSGGSLKDWLTQDPLSLTTIIPIIERITSALNIAHEKGIIHRDIKPSNILLDNQGNAYLSDFGIVKFSNTVTDTIGSVLVGTPAYMSPEQIQGDKPLDHRTDIYSLGIMLFEMLTGKRPFEADTPAKQMMAHALNPIPDIHSYNAELPYGTDNIINKAMAKEPENRYHSADEIAQDLSNLIIGLNKPTTNEITQTYSTTISKGIQHRRRYPILVSLIILLLFFILVIQAILNNKANNTDLLTTNVLTATETSTLTTFPAQSPTSLQTPQPVVIIRPTSNSTKTPFFEIVSLAEGSLLKTPETNLGLLPTNQSLNNIPFELGWKISTQCEHDTEQHQTSISVTTSIEKPQQIHILIQAGNGNLDYAENTIGKIILIFSDGQRAIEPLVLGHNIRDWRPNLPDFYVNSGSSYNLHEVWRGKTADGIDGRIDLLTIRIPEELSNSTLNNIEVTDTSIATVGSKNPCIHVLAITVEKN